MSSESVVVTPSQREIQEWVRGAISKILVVEPSEVDVDKELEEYGLGSIDLVSFAGDLEDWLGRELPPTLAFDFTTIRALSAYLSDGDPL